MVCYVPALDLRRVNQTTTPFIAGLLASYPWAGIYTLPNVDHVPTLLTGAYPHEHGLWGLKLRSPRENGSGLSTFVDALPDVVTTTAQCAVHALIKEVDLATMPTRRRRWFETKRFKFIKHANDPSIMDPVGGLPTLFTVLGRSRSTFLFHANMRTLDILLKRIGEGNKALELVEVHSLDSLQHWNLDRTAEIAHHYRTIDDFVRALKAKCARNDITFVLLSDHGMEPTTRYLDILAGLRRLGLSPGDVSYFIENTKATFWFHGGRSRSVIGDWLASLRHGHVLTYRDLARYGVCFTDAAYGDIFYLPDPGWSLFPNDFYHPVANLLIGLGDHQQRARMGNPRHRGDHGYLPEAESERGFILLADDRFSVRGGEARLVDVAPSLLWLLGSAAPGTMKGELLFAATA